MWPVRAFCAARDAFWEFSTYPSIQRRLRNNQDCIDKSVGLLRLKHIGRWLRNVGYRMEREPGWGALLSINRIDLLLTSFETVFASLNVV